MRIVIDAMGGDYAPEQVVLGAIEAVKEYNVEVILTGRQEVLNTVLNKHLPSGEPRVTVHHSEHVILMDDSPAHVLRSKRDSSIHSGLRLVKEKKADAFFSAGNTGAVMAVAKLVLRTLDGIDRPAIAMALPSMVGHSILIDAGANVDSKPDNYLQFAIMGSAYGKCIMAGNIPTVGLLSIGEEDMKGNEVTKSVFSLLKGCQAINFIGNVEAKELYKGKADVIVCDGFAGNIALKSSEAVASFVGNLLREEFSKSLLSKVGAMLVLPGLRRFKKRVNPEEYGGAPLLGVGGICIIGHGSSTAYAVKNAVRVAKEMVNSNINALIEDDVRKSFEVLRQSNP